jgi:hypothetical protein
MTQPQFAPEGDGDELYYQPQWLMRQHQLLSVRLAQERALVRQLTGQQQQIRAELAFFHTVAVLLMGCAVCVVLLAMGIGQAAWVRLVLAGGMFTALTLALLGIGRHVHRLHAAASHTSGDAVEDLSGAHHLG